MNVIALWLELIGTPERAKRLRARLDSLKIPPLDPLFGPEPLQCPLQALEGARTSQAAYSDARYRPALDAWDVGLVTTSDLRRYCLLIEKGGYNGPVFDGNTVSNAAKRRATAWAKVQRELEYQKRAELSNRRDSRDGPGAKRKSPVDSGGLEAAFREAFGAEYRTKRPVRVRDRDMERSN